MNLSFFYLLMLVLVVGYGNASINECEESRCRKHGPAIRFPFRIKNIQPEHCGFPGFDVSCIETKDTLIELPNSVKLYIDKIDYVSQVLYTSDPNNCLPKQLLNFNLVNSAFKFEDFQSDYVFFNCSSIDRGLYVSMPCLSVPGYDIHAFSTDYPVDSLDLTACTRIYNVSSVPMEFNSRDNVLSLKWSKPDCGFCEGKGKYCRLKQNSMITKPEIECFDKPKPSRNIGMKLMVAGIVLGVVLLVFVGSVLYWYYRLDKAEKENQRRIEKFLLDYKALRPARYLYSDIKRITNQFKDKLGEGTYGIVYKGKLSNEIFVAVKLLNNSVGNGDELINEVGTMGKIHHVNVVRLVGYCADGFVRALVYEYLPNESLEKFIFSDELVLGWEKLQDIALGIAKGIEYLHQGCDQRILHFDIKPHNILLDDNFNPKISDFGIAKLCSKDQSAVSMTTARGTMGYIAPEVFSRNFGNVSHKSDVYSFGMVLLDMVKGKKNIEFTDTNQVYFPEWAYKQLDQKEEPRFQSKEESDEQIAMKLIIVGLWCIQWHPVDRPSMKAVVRMFEGEGNKLTMPPNPFASAGPTANMVTHIQQDLPIIPETNIL